MLLQTVFLRLARREPGSDEVERMESYLRRAAVNAAVDIVRSRQAIRKVPLTDLEPRLAEDASRSPEARHGTGEVHTWLRSAISNLSPRAAEMFVLRYLEGYENPEIAKALKTSQAVVAVTLHRTRARLKKELRTFLGGKS
jgi:RNA polymerase sigma-70 factor (ECF subfamily)